MTVPELRLIARADYLAVVAGALATLSRVDPSLPVELGPGTRVADVISWSGSFAAAVTDQLSSVALAPRPPVAQPAELAVAGEALFEALSTVPLGRPCWTPSPAVAPQARFWLRRSAQALSVRAWQVQVAMNEPASLPAWLLRDGIEEHLRVLVAVTCADPRAPAGRGRGTISVRCTDIAASWQLRFEPGCVPEADQAGPVDAELTADAATLRLGLAGMLALPPGTGDATLLDALRLR